MALKRCPCLVQTWYLRLKRGLNGQVGQLGTYCAMVSHKLFLSLGMNACKYMYRIYCILSFFLRVSKSKDNADAYAAPAELFSSAAATLR